MMDIDSIFSTSNPVFQSYCFWSMLLVIKMFTMFILTKRQRMQHKITSNPEDLKKGYKIRFDNPHIERVRRAHRNDLENILPFFFIGLMYVTTNPEPKQAIYLFRAVGLGRIIHTIVYAVYVVRQPARGLAFFIAAASTFYMAVQTAIYYF